MAFRTDKRSLECVRRVFVRVVDPPDPFASLGDGVPANAAVFRKSGKTDIAALDAALYLAGTDQVSPAETDQAHPQCGIGYVQKGSHRVDGVIVERAKQPLRHEQPCGKLIRLPFLRLDVFLRFTISRHDKVIQNDMADLMGYGKIQATIGRFQIRIPDLILMEYHLIDPDRRFIFRNGIQPVGYFFPGISDLHRIPVRTLHLIQKLHTIDGPFRNAEQIKEFLQFQVEVFRSVIRDPLGCIIAFYWPLPVLSSRELAMALIASISLFDSSFDTR